MDIDEEPKGYRQGEKPISIPNIQSTQSNTNSDQHAFKNEEKDMNNQFETEKPNGNTQERYQAAEATTADQAARLAEAIDQMKKATSSIYEAISNLGLASGDIAKLKLAQSKNKALELENQAELKIAERPLLYVGAAFAVGWILAKLSR
jgi:hypothetical protein